MTIAEMIQLAVNNIENHLGDVCNEDTTPDEMYEEVFILATDALLDKGIALEDSYYICIDLAKEYSGKE